MTAITLKEFGAYVGFKEGLGYIYKKAETFYVYNGKGLNPLKGGITL